MHTLSKCLRDSDVVITDAGATHCAGSQGIELSANNQRYITSGAQSEMGFTVPGTVGAYFAAKHNIIGITGDGSLQLNIQELQTIVHHNIPVKLFIWNNDGYLSIRTNQYKVFNGRTLGTDKSNGLSFPDLSKISAAYGIKYFYVENPLELEGAIQDTLNYDGPVLCEVKCDPNQEIIPCVMNGKRSDGSVRTFDDMYPFLERDEYNSNILY
jgi:acetolactate synthase-1/2/3 large subunit